MLRPDASFNPTRDRFWFGVLTWVQPRAEVSPNKTRLVCRCPASPIAACRLSLILQCEIWWVYTKRNLINLCRNGEVLGASELVSLTFIVLY